MYIPFKMKFQNLLNNKEILTNHFWIFSRFFIEKEMNKMNSIKIHIKNDINYSKS